MQYVLLVYGVGPFRNLQAPIRMCHPLLTVYDAQQLRALYRTYVRVYRFVPFAQEYCSASMAHLPPCPHRNLCQFSSVVGGAAQDSLREMVLVWGKETPSVLMVGSQARRFCEPKGSVSATAACASAPSMGSVLRDVVNRKRYVNILLINKAMPPG